MGKVHGEDGSGALAYFLGMTLASLSPFDLSLAKRRPGDEASG